MITERNVFIVTANDVENIVAEYIKVKFKLLSKVTTKIIITCPRNGYELDSIVVTQENNYMNNKTDSTAVQEVIDRKIEVGQL